METQLLWLTLQLLYAHTLISREMQEVLRNWDIIQHFSKLFNSIPQKRISIFSIFFPQEVSRLVYNCSKAIHVCELVFFSWNQFSKLVGTLKHKVRVVESRDHEPRTQRTIFWLHVTITEASGLPGHSSEKPEGGLDGASWHLLLVRFQH